MHITNWSLRRSGPAMTLKGKMDGLDGQLPVVKVETRGRQVVAISREGHEYILRVDH